MSAPSSSGAAASPRSALPLRSLLLLGLAAGVAISASSVALRQQSRPDPFRPTDPLTEWWRYPMQRNAFARNEAFGGDLNAVYARPGGKRVWAVGDGALLLHSDDGGITWVQDTLDLSPEPDSGAPDAVAAPTVVPTTDSIITTLTSDTVSPLQGQTADTTAPEPTQKMSMLPLEPLAGLGRSALAWLHQPEAASALQQPQQQGVRGASVSVMAALLATALQARSAAGDGPAQDTLAVLTSRLRDVQFVNDTMGYAVGDGGVVLRSRDGGVHWRWVGTRLAAREATRLYFTSPDSGWIRTDTRLYRTTSGGYGWDEILKVTVELDRTRTTIVRVAQRELHRLQPADQRAIAILFADGAQRSGMVQLVGDSVTDGVMLSSGPPQPLTGRKPARTRTLEGSPLGITSVFYFDTLRGIAATAAGDLARTTDGGITWAPGGLSGPPLHDVRFVDADNGWAVGAEGTILSTENGGVTWMVRAGRRDRIRDVDFVDRYQGWAVGSGGAILHSADGGAHWTPQASLTGATLHAVSFISADSGWAVGAGGTVLRTTDGGLHWSSLPMPAFDSTPPTFYAVQMMHGGRGWISGSHGWLFTTSDQGESWHVQPTQTDDDLHAVLFRDARTGWAAGDTGRVLYTRDGGRSWTRVEKRTPERIEALTLAPDGRTVWAVGSQGLILRGSADTFEIKPSGTQTHFTDIRFTDGAHGWAAGWNGALYSTADSGATWRPDTTGTRADLLALDAPDDRHLLAAGAGSVFLRRDAGGRWLPTALPGPWFPAPWYGAAWLLVVVLMVLSVPPRRPPEVPDPVEGILISDRPLQPGDRDPFQLREVALGISRFLRNERTEPPLTMAVTGPWGTGKSSLMNLVRADLQRWGFRTVSFNAWHHQTEDHLLAAFLENVRRQAVPAWWHPLGLRFRLRLLWLRTSRYRPLAIVAALGAAVYAAWLLADSDRFAQVGSALASLVPSAEALKGKGTLDRITLVLGTLIPGPDQAPAVVGLLGFLGVAGAALRGARAFGVKPASLMASVTRAMRLRDLEAQTSFRHRFAADFDEVTRALSPRDMVIFVDDLDRCRSGHVLQILEAINFLVTSGRCVVIMGMDPERVLRSVGREFGEEAEDAADERAPAADAAEDPVAQQRRREAFARQYLEKLVNIEVPVPRGNDLQQRQLLEPTLLDTGKPTVRERLGTAARWTRPALVPALTVAACALILVYGRAAFRPAASPAGVAAAFAPEAPPLPAPGAIPAATNRSTSLTPAATEAPDTIPAAEPARAGFRLPRPGHSGSRIPLYVGIALALAAWVLRLLKRPDVVVHDTDDFRRALHAWSPYIVAARRPTPRAAKKFLNRVRYYAMRQSAHAAPDTLLERLKALPFRRKRLKARLRKLGFRAPGARRADETLPEPLLVALAAVQECSPATLADDAFYSGFGGFLGDVQGVSKEAHQRISALPYPTTITPGQRAHFARISAGIRMS